MADTASRSPAGDPVNSSGVVVPQEPLIKDPAAFLENHKRVLAEKRAAQEKLDALMNEKAEREKKELEQKGEYQKLLEIERAKAMAAESKLQELEEARLQGKKVRALVGALENGVDEKFFAFLPIDQVVIDPDTGEVNKTSAVQAAENFKKAYPELLKTRPGVQMPAAAPQGNAAGTISYQEWLKLPHNQMVKWKINQIIGD